MAGSGELTVRTAPVAGFLTGYLESAAVTPFELVKARPRVTPRPSLPLFAPFVATPRLTSRAGALLLLLQVRMQVKEHAGRYVSSVACARAVVASEGVTALYRGFGATCARNTTFNGVYFGLIFAGQRAVPPREGAADIAQNLALGAAAGAAATLLKAPFDVVKSRIQAQLPDAAGKLRYRHTWQACALVAREEGVAALWKGLGPMLLRCTLGFSISYAAFDAALAAMGAPRAERQAAAAAAAAESA